MSPQVLKTKKKKKQKQWWQHRMKVIKTPWKKNA